MNKATIHENDLRAVLKLLGRLEAANIRFKLARNQEEAISIEVAVPGQRWEIDCYASGAIDVEVFRSDGTIHDAAALDELFRNFSD